MGYYRSGGFPAPAVPSPPDLGYGDPEVPFPDPLADDETRLSNLMKAWRRMRDAKTKENEMGYYRAGDAVSGKWQAPMLLPDNPQDNVTYVTPGRQKQLDAGMTGYAPRRSRMNVGNVRALRRSMRRVLGFAHLARKVMTFTAHHKMKKARRRK